jgi:hypothetical protein
MVRLEDRSASAPNFGTTFRAANHSVFRVDCLAIAGNSETPRLPSLGGRLSALKIEYFLNSTNYLADAWLEFSSREKRIRRLVCPAVLLSRQLVMGDLL